MNNRALFLALPAFALVACDPEARNASLRNSPEPVMVAQADATGYTSKSGKRYHHQCKKGQVCTVTVTVTACSPDGITLDYGDLAVEPGNQDVDIRWNLVTKGYNFSADGIKFKGSDWQKEFDQPRANNNNFRWRDRNNMGTPAERPYPYTVTVVHNDGSACASKDPTVINDA